MCATATLGHLYPGEEGAENGRSVAGAFMPPMLLLGDFAIMYSHMTFRTKDDILRQGRYTDDWQLRNGKWLCVAANVIAEGL